MRGSLQRVALGDAPPWTRKFLTDNWDTIRQGSMPGGEWMPVEAPGSTPKRRLVDALGCGHYGCVFLTNTPGLVIKVSSDASEAEFIKAAVKLGEWPVGIVRYQAVLDLPGSHRGRPVFIIWREEAFDIGTIRSTGDRGAEREFALYHEAYLGTPSSCADQRFVRRPTPMSPSTTPAPIAHGAHLCFSYQIAASRIGSARLRSMPGEPCSCSVLSVLILVIACGSAGSSTIESTNGRNGPTLVTIDAA